MGNDSPTATPTRVLLNHSPLPPPPSLVVSLVEDSEIKEEGRRVLPSYLPIYVVLKVGGVVLINVKGTILVLGDVGGVVYL